MGTPIIRRKAFISGRVQGVFFRESCRRVAQDNNVSGYAKNLNDGRVEVVLEGAPDAVPRVLDWCQVGPSSAQVERVEVIEEEPRGECGFMKR